MPKRGINRCTVTEALTNGKWVEDIQGALGVRGEVSIEVMEFMVLWSLIEEVMLTEDDSDIHS